MFPVTIDAALNLIWLAIGVLSILLLVSLERRRHRTSTRRARCRRLLAVLTMTVALFPAVSSSDDIFSFSWINNHLSQHGGFGTPLPEDSKEKERAGIYLFRLLETLNHFQLSSPYSLSLTLCCLAVVLVSTRESLTRTADLRCGRAPPLV